MEADEPLWQPLNKTDVEGRAACQHQGKKRGRGGDASAETRRAVRAVPSRRLGSGRPTCSLCHRWRRSAEIGTFRGGVAAALESGGWQGGGKGGSVGEGRDVLDTSVDVD